MSVRDQIAGAIANVATPGNHNLGESATLIDLDGNETAVNVTVSRDVVEGSELMGADIDEMKGTVMIPESEYAAPVRGMTLVTDDEEWAVDGVKTRIPGANICRIVRKKFKNREW